MTSPKKFNLFGHAINLEVRVFCVDFVCVVVVVVLVM